MIRRPAAVTPDRPAVPTRQAAPDDLGLGGHPQKAPHLIHASAVSFLEKGVLLLGRSGSGKSDLALRLIDAGARLIADDQVSLRRIGDQLRADAPAKLRGLIELRGIGIMRVANAPGFLDLAVDLDDPDPDADRLPLPSSWRWQDVDLPVVKVDARAPSAVARIRMALEAERVF